MKFLEKFKKRKYISKLIKEATSNLWEVELAQYGKRKVLEIKQDEIKDYQKKIKELEDYIKEQKAKEKIDMGKIKEIIEEKTKVEEKLSNALKDKQNLEYDLGKLVEQHEAQRWYIDYILKNYKKDVV